MTKTEPRIFYSPATATSVDVVGPDGKGRYGGKTFAELQPEYPDLIETTLDDAASRTADFHRKPPVRITGERYNELLNVLPPEDWQHINGHTESFKLCERMTGAITLICARIGKVSPEFWQMYDVYTMPHARIVATIEARRGALAAAQVPAMVECLTRAIELLPGAWRSAYTLRKSGSTEQEAARIAAEIAERIKSNAAYQAALLAAEAQPETWEAHWQTLLATLRDVQGCFPDASFAEQCDTPRDFVERMEAVIRAAEGWPS